MSSEAIAAAAGVMISLVFSYIPGVADWYARLDGTRKRLVMLAGLVVIAAGAFGLSCLGFSSPGIPHLPACNLPGLQSLLEAFVIALVANQAAYLISPELGSRARANYDNLANGPRQMGS